MNALIARPVNASEWQVMREQAGILVKTGFLPEAIRTPEQAIAIMLKGRELNVPAMYALSNIVVIKGKPVANSELMLALIYRDHGDNAIRFTQSDEKVCTIAYRRQSWAEPEMFSFSMEDAKQAGLLSNQTWQKYPKAMLRARCISAVARMAFADTIGGLYTPEELGASVNEDGEILPAEQPALRIIETTGEIIDAEDPRMPKLRAKWERLQAAAREVGLDVPAMPDDYEAAYNAAIDWHARIEAERKDASIPF